MNESGLWGQIIQGGIATAALMVLILWLGKQGGVWVWARELVREREERVKDQANHETSLTLERAERAKSETRLEAQLTVAMKERDEWKQLALESTGVLERAARQAQDSS